jgi:DNA-binding transcriptional LysR family regulator
VPASRIAYRSNSLVNQLMAVRAGVGIALLPCYLADDEPAVRRVSRLMPEVESEMWIVTHQDLRNTARVRAFLALIGDAIIEARRAFEGQPAS